MSGKIVIYAPNISDLRAKTIGYNHDHCRTIFFGKSEYCLDLLNTNEDEYIAIFEQDVFSNIEL